MSEDTAKSSGAQGSRKLKQDGASEPKAFEVTLEHGRSRHLGWAAFGLIAGGALIWKLGTIGQVIGAVLVLTAVYQGYKALQTFLHPPGTFVLGLEKIIVPTGLCKGNDLELSASTFQHAYFLRRAVPWTMAGPLLVVESDGKAYTFPRDWFGSDSDQRRVEQALNQRLSSETPA